MAQFNLSPSLFLTLTLFLSFQTIISYTVHSAHIFIHWFTYFSNYYFILIRFIYLCCLFTSAFERNREGETAKTHESSIFQIWFVNFAIPCWFFQIYFTQASCEFFTRFDKLFIDCVCLFAYTQNILAKRF